MLKCYKCGEPKPYDQFSKSKRSRGRANWCKTCVKAYDAQRFQSNKAERMAQTARERQRKVEGIRTLKTENPCTDCGKSYHPAAMQFDHLPENKKVDTVAQLLQRGWSYERLLTEIAKCELVCANCHAVRTYNRRTTSTGVPVA